MIDENRTDESLGHLYERLAFELDDGGGGSSLSGYQCENPFAGDLVADVRRQVGTMDYQRYVYFDSDEELISRVRAFHCAVDQEMPEAIVCGPGASSQLFAFVTYLRRKRVRRVFYLPPLYFTLHVALDQYGIEAVPVADSQAYEQNFQLRLPRDEECCLLLADPIWYAGIPLSEEVMTAIATWQRRTGSFIFVDGSLQYMQWYGRAAEASARLTPSLTVRLICPTKQLAMHGYRFSYLLAPEREARSLAWTCANVAGAASTESVAFAHSAMQAIDTGALPYQLMQLVRTRHRSLRDCGRISSSLEPRCGYFVFERINGRLPDEQVLADGRYFEQGRYPGHYKLNLLSPSIGILSA